MDDTSSRHESPPPSPNPKNGRGLAFQLTALALVLVSALAGTGLARWLRTPTQGVGGAATASSSPFPGRLFADWKTNPDFVLVVSGQQYGYLLPCGCSKPQVGGLERRYNFLQMVKAAGWPYVAVDLGDLPQQHGPAELPNQQGMIKYVYSMKSLKAMGYTASGLGETETNLGLFNLLGEYALNETSPRVVAGNLIEADKNFPDQTEVWKLEEVKQANVKVGVTSIIGPGLAEKIKKLTQNDKSVRFERSDNAINRVLKDMVDKKVNLPVLLYQGPLGTKKPTATGATALAEAFPQFPIIACLSDEDEPPSRAVEVETKLGKTMLVTLGKKGKFIGVIGVWKTGKPPAQSFEYRYERVELTEDFLTPKEKEKGHPIVEMMEMYTRELKDKNYLEKYGQVRHPLQVMPVVPGLRNPGAKDEPHFVGSDKCKRCHEHAYEVWEKSAHAHAYKTLVDAERPAHRQYDPECIVCHTVGFGYHSGFISEGKTPRLKDVGCESCHGPSSLHVKNPSDVEWQKRINPWRHMPNKQMAKLAMDQMCQKCHDIDNDVHWIGGGFDKKWPLVAHPTPGKLADDDKEEEKKK